MKKRKIIYFFNSIILVLSLGMIISCDNPANSDSSSSWPDSSVVELNQDGNYWKKGTISQEGETLWFKVYLDLEEDYKIYLIDDDEETSSSIGDVSLKVYDDAGNEIPTIGGQNSGYYIDEIVSFATDSGYMYIEATGIDTGAFYLTLIRVDSDPDVQPYIGELYPYSGSGTLQAGDIVVWKTYVSGSELISDYYNVFWEDSDGAFDVEGDGSISYSGDISVAIYRDAKNDDDEVYEYMVDSVTNDNDLRLYLKNRDFLLSIVECISDGSYIIDVDQD